MQKRSISESVLSFFVKENVSRSLIYVVIFGMGSVLPILFLPPLITGTSLTTLSKAQFLMILTPISGYLIVLVVLFGLDFLKSEKFVRGLICVAGVLFPLPYLVSFSYLNPDIKNLFLTSVSISVAYILLFLVGKIFRKTVFLVLIASTFGVLSSGGLSELWLYANGRLDSVSTIRTAFYDLTKVSYKGKISADKSDGGAIKRLLDHYLVVTGDGRLYTFGTKLEQEGLELSELPYRVPINKRQFARTSVMACDWRNFAPWMPL